jgi:hypothetical protein
MCHQPATPCATSLQPHVPPACNPHLDSGTRTTRAHMTSSRSIPHLSPDTSLQREMSLSLSHLPLFVSLSHLSPCRRVCGCAGVRLGVPRCNISSLSLIFNDPQTPIRKQPFAFPSAARARDKKCYTSMANGDHAKVVFCSITQGWGRGLSLSKVGKVRLRYYINMNMNYTAIYTRQAEARDAHHRHISLRTRHILTISTAALAHAHKAGRVRTISLYIRSAGKWSTCIVARPPLIRHPRAPSGGRCSARLLQAGHGQGLQLAAQPIRVLRRRDHSVVPGVDEALEAGLRGPRRGPGLGLGLVRGYLTRRARTSKGSVQRAVGIRPTCTRSFSRAPRASL